MEHVPAVVVAGARQVGKSTLLRHLLGDRADFVVFDPVADVEGARAEPDLFLDNHKTPLVLDEIQYVPQLVAALKRRIDADRRPGMFVITGSQQWEVLRSLADSLAGRVAFLDLEGFSLAELAGRGEATSWLERWLTNPMALVEDRPQRLPAGRSLFERLFRGFLPEAEFLPLDIVPEFHSSYQRTYIERDVRQLSNVADWMQFGRFFRLAAALTAQEINQSHLGRDIGITPQTARRWLEMLMATYQWHEVPAWTRNPVKRLSHKPKGYLADCGLAASALRISSPQALADHPAMGALFETAAVGEVRRLASLLAAKPGLYHWRSHGGAEVDLVLERDGRLFPIEIKATTSPSRRDARGIEAFFDSNATVDTAPGLVLAPINTVLRLGDRVFALPWDLAPAK